MGSLTGLAHFLSIFSLGVAVRFLDKEQIGDIGKIDANILLVTSIIAFGLQIATTRDIALSDNWHEKIKSTQSARFTLSLFLVAYGVIEFLITKSTASLVYLIAPFIALNADFVLYGIGKPIIASFFSFIKVLIPGIVLILISVFFSSFTEISYVISTAVGLIISGVLITRTLQSNYFQSIDKKFIQKYLRNTKIGLASLSITMLSLGQIAIARFFYDDAVISNAYTALKLYVLYRGAQRLIIQSFYRDINDDDKNASLDNFGIIIGFLFFIIAAIYAKLTISYLYGQEYISSYTNLTVLAAAALISSILTTGSPKLLLLKKDHQYFTSYTISAIVSVTVSIGFSYTALASFGIAAGIFIGELCLFLLFTKHLGGLKYLYPRLISTLIYTICLGIIIYITSFLHLPDIYNAMLNVILFGLGALCIYYCLLEKKRISVSK